MAQDLFAPPSADELKAVAKQSDGDIFAPPTADELSKAGSAGDVSLGQAIAGKTAEGATLGGLPIVAGGLGALASFLGRAGVDDIHSTDPDTQAKMDKDIGSTGSSLQSLLDAYRQTRDESKATLNAASQQHPIASTAANIAGGALGGAGLAKAGVLSAGAIANAPTKLQALLQAAKLGGTAGAISGGLSSNADLTKGEIGQELKDIAGGAETGAATGAVVQGGLQALSGAGNAISNGLDKYKIGKQLKRAFDMGSEGEGISQDADIEKITDKINTQAKKLTNFLQDTVEDNWNKKLDILKNSGQQINLQDIENMANQEINNAVASAKLLPDQEDVVRKTLQNALYKKLPNQIQQITKETIKAAGEGEEPSVSQAMTLKGKGMTPEELQAQMAQAQQAGAQMQPVSAQITANPNAQTTTATQQLAPPALGDVDPVEAAQRIRNLQGQAFDVNKPQVAPLLRRIAGKASDMMQQQIPDITQPNQMMSTALEAQEQLGQPDFIRNLGSDNPSPQTLNFIKDLQNTTDPGKLQLKQTMFGNPNAETDAGKKGLLGMINPDLAQQMKNEGEQVALDNSITKASGETGISSLQSLLGSVKGTTLKAANVAGQVANKVSSMYNWPSSRLNALGDQFMSSQDAKSQALGKSLKSLATTEPDKRAAMLFAVSQNKDFRDMIGRMIPDFMTMDSPTNGVEMNER